MATKRELERQLAGLSGFVEPQVALEQYATPAHLAATMIHLADLQGDLDRPVIDLGTGTGMLAIAAALRGAPRVVGIERDRSALEIARDNARSMEIPLTIDWIQGDATRPPVSVDGATVVMNPPFGAQRDHRHADRAFLEAVSELASVSYSIHNAGSWEFVEPYSVDNGGTTTHAYRATLALERQFDFHEAESTEIEVEVFRIEWA